MAGWLYILLYRLSALRNKRINQLYKKQHPDICLPPDYALYETFQRNYRKFIEDGAMAAKEVIEWTKPYITTLTPCLLDWGCGTGRIIRHLPALQPAAILYGCDINEEMIDWNKTHYSLISFTCIHNFTPMPYAPLFFDLVYGMSIFTHIETTQQLNWIIELHRILKRKGILLITTQGVAYHKKLLPGEKKIVADKGVYTQTYSKQGHRMMSTYHKAGYFIKMIASFFTVLEFYDGAIHPGKIGGQDLWILQKTEKE